MSFHDPRTLILTASEKIERICTLLDNVMSLICLRKRFGNFARMKKSHLARRECKRRSTSRMRKDHISTAGFFYEKSVLKTSKCLSLAVFVVICCFLYTCKHQHPKVTQLLSDKGKKETHDGVVRTPTEQKNIIEQFTSQ